MPRRKKKEKIIKCKKCGYEWKPNEVEPIKTWHLVAPFPDKEGRLTITIMAVWVCPKCGARVRGVYSKIKAGDTVDIESRNRTKLLIEALSQSNKVDLVALSSQFKVSFDTIKQAVSFLLKSGKIKGRIEGNYFIKEE